jgi:hypothetical protein
MPVTDSDSEKDDSDEEKWGEDSASSFKTGSNPQITFSPTAAVTTSVTATAIFAQGPIGCQNSKIETTIIDDVFSPSSRNGDGGTVINDDVFPPSSRDQKKTIIDDVFPASNNSESKTSNKDSSTLKISPDDVFGAVTDVPLDATDDTPFSQMLSSMEDSGDYGVVSSTSQSSDSAMTPVSETSTAVPSETSVKSWADFSLFDKMKIEDGSKVGDGTVDGQKMEEKSS